jgi:hypothetical protein
MKDVLSTLKKLPPKAAAVINGEAMFIRRGAATATPSMLLRTDQVDQWNQANGVSREQQQAMLVGLNVGWDHDGADPDTHRREQEGLDPNRSFTFFQPLGIRITVRATSMDDAVEEAASYASQFCTWVNSEWTDPDFGHLAVEDALDLVEEE